MKNNIITWMLYVYTTLKYLLNGKIFQFISKQKHLYTSTMSRSTLLNNTCATQIEKLCEKSSLNFIICFVIHFLNVEIQNIYL